MQSQVERIAVLEEQMTALQKRYEEDVDEIKTDLKTLVTAFNQMTGGKRAVVAISVFVGGIVGTVATALSIFAFWKHY